MGEALTIEARHERGYPVVTVAGEIDIATAARLRERLFELAASGRPLVADLDQVRFIDSAGLSALVGAANRAAAHGGSLHVVCARPRIRQLFRLTGLDRRLPPARTLDEALDAVMTARAAGPGPGGARTTRPCGPEREAPASWPASGPRPPGWEGAMRPCGLPAMLPAGAARQTPTSGRPGARAPPGPAREARHRTKPEELAVAL